MIPAAAHLAAELDQETTATRRLLERLPEEHLDWRPHPKSMSLGQLANHLAGIPGAIGGMSTLPSLDASTVNFEPTPATSRAEVLATLDSSVATLRQILGGLTEENAGETWRMTLGDREIFAVPRLVLLRSLAFNHWYHHRGQLCVYLRLLDVPLPAVYGASADENPFGA